MFFKENMITKFNQFITEDAEEIRNWYTNDILCNFTDNDARSFGYYEKKMLVGIHQDQWHSFLSSLDLAEPPEETASRWELTYPGRMWLKKKIISFYSYPPPEKMQKVLKDIKRVHNKIRNKKHTWWNNDGEIFTKVNQDKEIDWTTGWRIEILTDKEDNDCWLNCEIVVDDPDTEGEDLPKLIPLEDYIGSSDVPEIDMRKAHVDWKVKQQLKAKGWGRGWGSDMTAPDGKNPLQWRQAKYVENKKYK